MPKKTQPMTQKAASRVQRATAKAGNGQVAKESFAARAAKTVAKSSNGGKSK